MPDDVDTIRQCVGRASEAPPGTEINALLARYAGDDA